MKQGPARPKARNDIIVSELADEALAYDFVSHRAHCMSPAAFAVFRRCDGATEPAALAAALGVSPAAVERALAALAEAGLLEAPPPRPAPRLVDRGRRRAMQQVALVVAAPLVWSIVAPTVAEAASRVTCVPTVICMGAAAGTCCGVSGTAAGSCNGLGSCGAASGTCAGATCQ